MSSFFKQIIFSLVIMLFSCNAIAQVAKNIIVEHFTNTWCPICTSTNPGIYENLNKHEGVLHITYHPSKPYPNCELNKHNPAENDGRTRFYSVYGSTPRLVIQGSVVARNADYSSKAIFESHLEQTSPVSMVVEQFRIDEENIETKILITNEMDHDLVALKIFGGMAEKLIQFDAQNGEKEHFDVFRKAFTSIEGDLIRLDKNKGAVVEISYILATNEAWTLDQMFSFAILQTEDDKVVVQSNVSLLGEFSGPVNTIDILKNPVIIFPNPASDVLHIVMPSNETSWLRLFDNNGKLYINTSIGSQEEVDIYSLPKGLYFAELEQNGQRYQQKFLKK